MMNPLDWYGEAFLLLYLAVGGIAVLVVALLRWMASQPAAAVDTRNLDALDLAYLVGGSDRTADTALVAFLASRVASLDDDNKRISFDAAVPVPPMLQLFGDAVLGATSRSQFHKAAQDGIRVVAIRLSRRGLVPNAARLATLAWATILVMAVPLVLGGMKVLVGMSRGRPVGYLILLMIATGLALLVFLGRPPFRTPAGTDALRQHRDFNERAARAPMASEMALAFALSGPIMLMGTPYAALARQIQSPSGSDGSGGDSGSSDGGGDGGGGDSGCGGCGGGGGGE